MCHLVRVAALQHETQELLEESAIDRLVSIPVANELERSWELDADYYDMDCLDEPRQDNLVEPVAS